MKRVSALREYPVLVVDDVTCSTAETISVEYKVKHLGVEEKWAL